MRKLLLSSMLMLAASGGLRPEIIDRVAITVDRIVITESDILNQLRIAAFLDQRPPDLGPDGRKDAGERLVEQVLVRREMQISRYPAPSPDDVAPLLEQILAERSYTPESYEQALTEYGVTDGELRENLLLQLTLLRFIEYRFRPGVSLTDEEVEQYYAEQFVPAWQKQNTSAPPELDDVRGDIEEILTQMQVDDALDVWLEDAVTQARIRYRQEAFE